MRRLALIATAFSLALLWAQDPFKSPETAAPYYPTPQVVVEKMLELGELKKGEKTYDLGSGDGRFVITAARKYGAKAVGVELDKKLVAESRAAIKRQNLEASASIIDGNLFDQEYKDADLITVYLLPVTNAKLSGFLEKQLKKGARVVCHDFEFQDWNPERTIEMEDQEGRAHTLFLYRR